MKDDLNRLSQDLKSKFHINKDFAMNNYHEISKPNQGLAALCKLYLSRAIN